MTDSPWTIRVLINQPSAPDGFVLALRPLHGDKPVDDMRAHVREDFEGRILRVAEGLPEIAQWQELKARQQEMQADLQRADADAAEAQHDRRRLVLVLKGAELTQRLAELEEIERRAVYLRSALPEMQAAVTEAQRKAEVAIAKVQSDIFQEVKAEYAERSQKAAAKLLADKVAHQINELLAATLATSSGLLDPVYLGRIQAKCLVAPAEPVGAAS